MDNLKNEVLVADDEMMKAEEQESVLESEDENIPDKDWLISESARIEKEKKTLDEEKRAFVNYQKSTERRLAMLQKQIDTEKSLFDQKLKILQAGYQQLEHDRKAVERDKRKYHMNKSYENEKTVIQYISIHSFFKGVNSMLALKKRYKDLMKIFHPDNLCGDNDTVQMINKEYDSLKEKYLDLAE